MNILIKIKSIESRNDGSGDIAVDTWAYAQEDDLSEYPIPNTHKTILINADLINNALALVDLNDPIQIETALLNLALKVARQDPVYAESILLENVMNNKKSSEVANLINNTPNLWMNGEIVFPLNGG